MSGQVSSVSVISKRILVMSRRVKFRIVQVRSEQGQDRSAQIKSCQS